jgi:D-alanyl-D-alanine carboxypeptidase
MRTPGWGTSSKQTMIRATDAGRSVSRIEPGHLLLGVLRAEGGTVPRTLAFAGVDQVELATKTQAALDAMHLRSS